MSEHDRWRAEDKRCRFWTVFDNVPEDQMTSGCEWCESGWAKGPGLVYRCDNCNPAKDGQPLTFSTKPEYDYEPQSTLWKRLRAWWYGQ
jgi:hypothetical protein